MSNNSIPKQSGIFLHIHKTAGTTLHAILQRQYADEDVYSIDAKGHNFDHFTSLSQSERTKICLLKGHLVSAPKCGTQSTQKNHVSSETIALLAQLNQTDKVLYHYGRSLFEAQIAKQGILFPYRTRLFRWLNHFTKPYWQLCQYSRRIHLHKLRNL